jgi:hypothetical protein
VPSDDEADNRRRSRAKDRIPRPRRTAGPVEGHRRDKPWTALLLQDRASHLLRCRLIAASRSGSSRDCEAPVLWRHQVTDGGSAGGGVEPAQAPRTEMS